MATNRPQDWKAIAVGWCIALLIAVGFLIATGLIPGWKKWYSSSVAYREQTEALLRGSLALNDTPSSLRVDLLWHNGGVHQVWGLGVPLWRLPFEGLAKAFGQPGFPDRLEFGAALMLLAYFAIRILLLQDVSRNANWTLAPLRATVLLLILLFPPFLTVCRFCFSVYEEAVAYAYLYGIGLLLGLVSFIRVATPKQYLVLCALAGLAPLIRPTLGAYGLSTMLLLWVYGRNARLHYVQLLIGLSLFCLGGLALLLTNSNRFGSAVEFGHSLNINGFPIWFFGRFYNPFQKEPIMSAARELFGAVFCSPDFNVGDWSQPGLFWGQSSSPRWRHFYATCFDLSYLPVILAGWISGLTSLMAKPRNLPCIPIEGRATAVWSMTSALILFIFYLRTPFISNRYILDLAPSLAAAIIAFLFTVEGLGLYSVIGKRSYFAVILLISFWMAVEICLDKSAVEARPVLNRAEMLEVIRVHYSRPVFVKNSYDSSSECRDFGIPFNGLGWKSDGQMDTVVTLFVKDPEYVQLRVKTVEQSEPVDISKLQVKIGLESLVKESWHYAGEFCEIRFKIPARSAYRQGIQTVFVAYVNTLNPTAAQSPLQLVRVQWRDSL